MSLTAERTRSIAQTMLRVGQIDDSVRESRNAARSRGNTPPAHKDTSLTVNVPNLGGQYDDSEKAFWAPYAITETELAAFNTQLAEAGHMSSSDYSDEIVHTMDLAAVEKLAGAQWESFHHERATRRANGQGRIPSL